MRSKLPLLGLVALGGVLALVSATQTWVALRLIEGAAATDMLLVSGQDLNASLSPVAIAVLAAALALTIAGRVFRWVLGVLITGLGAGIAAMSVGVLSGPVQAASGKLAEITAISGASQLDLVSSADTTIWPLLTVATGILLAVLGVAVVVLSGRWRAAGRKYESGSGASASAAALDEPDRISDWERQNEGEDPSESGADDRTLRPTRDTL